MRSSGKKLYLSLAAVLSGVFVFFFFEWYPDIREDRIYHISVILNTRDDTNWKNTIAGMRKAAGDYNVDLSIITLYDTNSTLQQLDFMRREVLGEADALIVAPSDYKAFSIGIREMDLHIPLVVLGPVTESEKISVFLSPDDKEMGRAMGNMIVNGTKKNEVVILSDSLRLHSLAERYEGLKEILEENNMSCTLVECSKEEDVIRWLEEHTGDKEVDMVAVLSEELFLLAARAIDEGETRPGLALYGFGGSSHSLYFLDKRIAAGLVVPNQYVTGYYAVSEGVAAITDKKASVTVSIDFVSVTPDNLFYEENLRILFPN